VATNLKIFLRIDWPFSVHTVTEAKHLMPNLGRTEPGRWIFQPGHLTRRAMV